jgi:type II restriction/modification system DNA methylase subunit YeeA
MNTNRLKKFAQETRKKLLDQVSAKVDYVITTDTPELREKAGLVATIKNEIAVQGKQQLVDKVAYTWFNRFVALRYMDVNDYQPLGIRILSALPEQVSPQILQEAVAGNISEDLNINEQEVFDLLDGRTESRNAENEAYRLLLIGACNYLNRIFPFLFERINDYTELLLPDDLTSQFSVLCDVVLGMNEEDCSQVECIGWLYQFYISEKKDEVFAAKSKVKKEDIPAATQLFTPRWIVEYMVQNTVGKIWLQNHPDSGLKKHMPYYIESEANKGEDYLKISSPEELTLLDQACGSGHILVYGFELLYKIYEEQGYNPSEIPALIINNNLFGFEIDSRAAQLAGLAVLLKAREFSNRLFKKVEIPEPHILCFSDCHLGSEQIKGVFTKLGIKLSDELHHDLNLMSQATNLGSLIAPHSHVQELIDVKEQLATKEAAADLFLRDQISGLLIAINQLIKLSKKYYCVVDNPPYMGSGAMNTELTNFIKISYTDSKADLMACFMEAGLQCLVPNGMLGMINQHSWMFLSSYENLRNKLIENYQFGTLLHLGPRTFPEIGGEVVQNASFTIENSKPQANCVFIRLVDFDRSSSKMEHALEAIKNDECEWLYNVNQAAFKKIPGSPLGYWLNDNITNIFSLPRLDSIAKPKSGMSSTNNERFLRYWYEIDISKFSSTTKNTLETLNNKIKWYPYGKGGEFRKWAGNLLYCINFYNDGEEIKFSVMNNPQDPNTTHWSRRIFGVENFFKKGITWSRISSSKISFRVLPEGTIFSDAGPALFNLEDESLYCFLLGFLNSKISFRLLQVLNPTLTFQVGNIASLPICYKKNLEINTYVKSSIEISESEWDCHEESWNFRQNELVRMKSESCEESFDLFQQYWKIKFFQLYKNEEELNRQFIEIYRLDEELKADVNIEDITILKGETKILNGQLVFNENEISKQFISYAIGCIFGRYSLDKEGLILATQGQTTHDYYQKIGKTEADVTFAPDEDNIIPILEDEWFEDDVVSRFYQFLRMSFGEKSFQSNLAFLEEQIGCSVRKYFTKEFYIDHIQRYKKRPIYWLFSSPKGHFNVLVYMHRYTPDTLNIVLNNYLRAFIEKLNVRMENLKHIENTGSPAEKTRALKEMDKINAMLLDIQDYERNILYPLATERIVIDLDNGVLVNYNCFGKAVKEVAGLNDVKTKKKVKEFDWIDSKIIR